MQLISRATLVAFWSIHPEVKPSLERWMRVVKAASWTSMSDVQSTFPKAKVLNAERVRFAIHGGAYRMIVAFDFAGHRRIAYIKFVGTHAQYDAVDALTVASF